MKPANDASAEQWEAWLDEIEGIGPPKPKAVVVENEVVRDADPYVSRADPNSPGSDGGVVRVRRKDWVTVNIGLWEEQQRQRAEDRRQRRMIDPFRLGHWDGEE